MWHCQTGLILSVNIMQLCYWALCIAFRWTNCRWFSFFFFFFLSLFFFSSKRKENKTVCTSWIVFCDGKSIWFCCSSKNGCLSPSESLLLCKWAWGGKEWNCWHSYWVVVQNVSKTMRCAEWDSSFYPNAKRDEEQTLPSSVLSICAFYALHKRLRCVYSDLVRDNLWTSFLSKLEIALKPCRYFFNQTERTEPRSHLQCSGT